MSRLTREQVPPGLTREEKKVAEEVVEEQVKLAEEVIVGEVEVVEEATSLPLVVVVMAQGVKAEDVVEEESTAKRIMQQTLLQLQLLLLKPLNRRQRKMSRITNKQLSLDSRMLKRSSSKKNSNSAHRFSSLSLPDLSYSARSSSFLRNQREDRNKLSTPLGPWSLTTILMKKLSLSPILLSCRLLPAAAVVGV
jgi:hypothetical protein